MFTQNILYIHIYISTKLESLLWLNVLYAVILLFRTDLDFIQP